MLNSEEIQDLIAENENLKDQVAELETERDGFVEELAEIRSTLYDVAQQLGEL